ncbi:MULTISPECIES: oxidoreductase [Virgibacillus]|uniref:NADH oxidase n=2 Tax=Virgibacillus TaxID=84406 RepID=A0A024Q5R4_9BACI|nr:MULTISPECIES: NADH:flavin oxidoreductase [Virgibacillus]EQB38667.1 NADH:flavin oxidoreductase [Virgibacillus sp. CM-4]MYL41381.1 NADH:flavin oxidoreductase [Virgibacillus massiliensis]GGJ56693.1 NADH:flavin oxidoreductase [Virgibacillus kapii]CDQ37824.1 NADH oxidase [Virgibacillus massiliensis]
MNNLFEQAYLGMQILKNRYIVAPMTRVSSEKDGTPNERVSEYYERFAKGGFAAVITEGVYPDTKYSQGYENQGGLATEKHATHWKPIVDRVKSHGSLMIAQLMHAGAQSQGSYYSDVTVAPSPFSPPQDKVEVYGGSGPFPTAKELSVEEMTEIKQSFAQSAIYAKQAGFDGVELHGANGYLLDEFLSEISNHRTDQYGGSVENRLRFLKELIEEVRAAIGGNMILGIRISQLKATNGSYKWPGGEADAEIIFSELGKTDIDYIHISDDDAATSGFGEGTMTMSEAAKAFSGKPVIACGQLGDPEKASTVIEKGQADFIGVARQALANPDTPNRVKEGRPLDKWDGKAIMTPKAYIKDFELEM